LGDMYSQATRLCTLPRRLTKAEVVRKLIAAGADVHARNRIGDEPLHAAAVGIPGSRTWNPSAQAATIVCIIKAGADPNTVGQTWRISPAPSRTHALCRGRSGPPRIELIPHAKTKTVQRRCNLEHWPRWQRLTRGEIAATRNIAAA
jgi:hypothetical protein